MPTTKVQNSRALFWRAHFKVSWAEAHAPPEGSNTETPSASMLVVTPPDPEIKLKPRVAGRRKKPGARVG